MAELSRSSGVPVPSIKYYIREGLLEPGLATGPNQADYGQDHVHRLRLIRVLRDVGGLTVAATRSVIDAIADTRMPLHDLLGVAHSALGPPPDHGPVPEDVARARADVDEFLDQLDWRVDAGHPARRALADALVALRRLGRDQPAQVFAPYAQIADRLAARELQTVATGSRQEAVEDVVVGTVVFEAGLVALRRMAQARHSAARFAGPLAGPGHGVGGAEGPAVGIRRDMGTANWSERNAGPTIEGERKEW